MLNTTCRLPDQRSVAQPQEVANQHHPPEADVRLLRGDGLVGYSNRVLENNTWIYFREHFQLAGDTNLEAAIFQWRSFAHWSMPLPRACLVANAELAELLHIRFRSHSCPDDLEESICIHQHILDHVSCYPSAVVKLAEALAHNLSHTSAAEIIERAITLLDKALLLHPVDSSARPIVLHALVVALCHPKSAERCFDRVPRAVQVVREFMDTTSLKRPNLVHVPAASLDVEEVTGVRVWEPALLFREALSLGSCGHPNRPRVLPVGHLGHLLTTTMCDGLGHLSPDHRHHNRGSSVNALIQCVSLNPKCPEEEVQNIYVYVTQTDRPAGRDHHATVLTCLAQVLDVRFALSGDSQILQRAIKFYREATEDVHAQLHFRLAAGKGWIAATRASSSVQDTLQAYETVIGLLPRYTYLDLRVQLQQTKKNFGPLPVDAAGYALAAGQSETAVSLLEQGRAILWMQLLQLRESFYGLPDDLVTQLTEAGRQVEQLYGKPVTSGEAGEGRVLEQITLHRKFQALLQEARAIPGFRDFLLPPAYSALASVAAAGPVVVLVSTKTYGSAAIIIRTSSSAPEHLPLPDASYDALAGISIGMKDSVRDGLALLRADETTRLQLRKVPRRQGASDPLAMLWKTVVRPVLLKLGVERCTSYDKRPRLWWCCAGPFVSLPVHAAGAEEPEALYASDYVVSSYTPTLGCLVNTRKPSGQKTAVSGDILVVATPDAPGYPPIPNTVTEAATIRALLKGERLHVDLKPRVADVIEKLRSASVIHLACHGIQNSHSPLDSGFVLNDCRLSLADIMRLGRLPHAFFAFLSACQSAAGDKEQPDESVHLAAAIMFAGFRSIVATLWSMNDKDGPMVAEHVYSELFQGGSEPTFNSDRIPFALDKAVRKLREDGVHWTRWATYIHMGI